MSQRNERPRFAVKPVTRPAGSPDLILIGRLALAALLLILGAFPLITIQILGVVYRIREKRAVRPETAYGQTEIIELWG